MNIQELHEQISADIGGPSLGALPAFAGDKVRPHKGGGGGSSTTTTQIPTELKPLASAYANKAMGLSNQQYQPYPVDLRYEPLNAYQDQGIARIAQRVGAGSGTIANAENQLNQIIAGGQQNPYLDKMVQKAQDSVRSNFNTAAINSGSFGNSGLQDQLAENLGDTASQMYGQAYETDRGRQMQGISMAQQFGNQAYTDAEQMLRAGQVMQDQNQQVRDFDYQQFQEGQNLPYKQLAAMSGVFSSGLGGQTVTKQKGGGK